ncbi:MAG: hypothetical protein ACLQGV_10165 [Bryobacteraceae bacterium]
MADFRKWFLVLAVLALVAVPVSAQQPTCTLSSSPTVVRDGGLTELVGDVVVVCDNTVNAVRTAPATVVTDFYAAMNLAQVTNKVLSTSAGGECPTGIQCVTDSILAESDPAGFVVYPAGLPNAGSNVLPIIGLLQSNLGGTDAPNTRNKVLFENVVIPAGTVTTIRISNIRVACEQSPATVANGLTQIYEQVSSNNVSFSGENSVPVATVLVPMQFKVTGCNGSGSGTTTFKQCVGQNESSPMTSTFNVEFIEGFALAFKPENSTTSQPVGFQFLSESGYLNGPGWSGTLQSPGGSTVQNVGQASTGTNLIVGFTNIPAGINIFVTDSQVMSGTSMVGAVFSIEASDLPMNTSAGSMSCPNTSDSSLPSHQVPIVGGAGSVAWVVTSVNTNLNYQKTISFGVAVSYTPNTTLNLPGLTVPPGGGVTGALGPISTTDWAVPITTAPIPRFLNNPISAAVFSVVPCATNILFPYLTVKAGFDTGIALVNTSLDSPVIGTQTQQGPCTMYYFDASGSPPAPQTSCNILPGGMVAFSLMGTGGIPSQTCANGTTVTNTPVVIGWQGYGIAACSFQYGHGYAFISDRNIPGLGSQGYLALILTTCPPRLASINDGDIGITNCGEVLAH